MEAPGPVPAQEGPRSGAVRLLRRAVALACTAILTAMMALTVADVLGRYIFTAPVPGAAEATELMLAAVIFLGLPAATLDREQVTVDLLTERLPQAVRRALTPLVALVSTAALALIGRQLWVAAAGVASWGGTTSTLEIPIAPFGFFAALMCWLSALVALAHGAAPFLPARAPVRAPAEA